MSDLYNVAVQRYLTTGWAWTSESNDIRMLLLKSSGPPIFVSTHATITAVKAHADNTECNDASYARRAIAHTNRTVTNTARKTQAHITSAVDFEALDVETVGAAVLYLHVGADDDNNIPIAFLTSTDFPIVTNGAGFTVNDGADGLFEAEGV